MIKYLMGIVLVLTLFATSVWAEEKPRAVIIFDASGSMWGQIDGVTKLEIARDALKNVVKEWNPNVELGLTAYGHRTKGDCDDIETLIPASKIDKNKMISTVFALNPKGKTPISRAIKKVAKELKYTEEKATIILISDGKETCDPDPCATAKELEAKGIDFITHVIGFNVDKKTDKQLECIASSTGGEYFSAKNATALNSAMKVIAKKVEVVKLKPKPIVKALKNNLEISASEKEGGKWIGAYHSIYKMIDGQVEERIASESSTKKRLGEEQLPVGKYMLKSSYNEFKKETAFEIKAGEVTKIHVVMGETGKLEISASEKEGGKWIGAYHSIYKMIDGQVEERIASESSTKKRLGEEQLPVGKYMLKSSYNEFKKETAFEIKAGEVTKIHVLFGQFMIKAKCDDSAKQVQYEIYASSGQLVYEKKLKCSETLKITLDNGEYTVEAKVGSGTKEMKFTVGGSESKLLLDMTTTTEDLDKEALIQLDSQAVQKENKPMVKDKEDKASNTEDMKEAVKGLEQLGALLGQMSKAVGSENAKDMNEAGAFLNALGGMMDPEKTKEIEEKKKEQNIKADKAFDDMSQELQMFTK
ncbi:MAG: Unknown protein [uncultured Sulfurovum sp.]|uniref:VWFA domain-containing protein n=1 Tax=uncultured Sulfurovum sp. TaxID=269237 RepID=A0A6S6UAZ5_9BACT|nr:MAG: Unknown protein [uncultured Sulfurovum sp.]